MYDMIFGVIPSYWLMITISLISAMMVYRILSTTYGFSDATFRRFGYILLVVVALGFVFAYLFQLLYDVIAGKEVSLKEGGITFMGGLLGAVAAFFVITIFAVKGKMRGQIWSLVCIAAPAVAIAHSFGRIGCFLGGCCYGKPTDSWIGITFHGVKRIPTQLFEVIFLAILFAVLMVLVLKFRRYNLTVPVYLFAYSVFRFILEFFRGDEERSVVGALSPSQWQSIFMFAVGIFVCVWIFWLKRVPFNGKQDKLSLCELTRFRSGTDEEVQP